MKGPAGENALRREDIDMNVGKRLTEGNIYKNYLLYALPLVLSSIMGQLYSTVDAVVAGKYIGETALGAVSAAGSVEAVMFAFFNGFAAGFSIYLSRLFGRREYGRIRRDTFSLALFLGGGCLLISALLIVFRNPLFDFLKVDDVLRRDTEIYFVITIGVYFIRCIERVLGQVLPAMGVTSYTLYVSIGSSLLNIVGDVVAVAVFRMGVAGLAFATVFSTLCQVVIYLILIVRAFRGLPVEKGRYRFRFSDVAASFRYTLPTALQQVAFHGVSLFVAPPINGLGAAATAGYNVANRIYSLSSTSIWNLTSAISCYTAQCAGEGSLKKIPKGLRAGFLLNTVTLVPVLGLCLVFARPVVSIFFPAGFEGDSFLYALRYVQVFLPFLLIQMVEHVFHSYLRSVGAVGHVFWISLFGALVRLVTTYLLVPVLGMDGVFLSQIFSWVADTAVTLVLYCARYRTEAHLRRAILKEPEKPKSLAS